MARSLNLGPCASPICLYLQWLMMPASAPPHPRTCVLAPLTLWSTLVERRESSC